ncbi:hypothetical protein ABBQ32_012718 [Trebouxia sp. C0010 RCD-2024]
MWALLQMLLLLQDRSLHEFLSFERKPGDQQGCSTTPMQQPHFCGTLVMGCSAQEKAPLSRKMGALLIMIVAWAGQGSALAGSIQQSHLLLLTTMAHAELWRQDRRSQANRTTASALSTCCACLSLLQQAPSPQTRLWL